MSHAAGGLTRRLRLLGSDSLRRFFRLIKLYKRAMTDAQLEEIKRHVGVVAEALRSDIRQIAEGHSGI